MGVRSKQSLLFGGSNNLREINFHEINISPVTHNTHTIYVYMFCFILFSLLCLNSFGTSNGTFGTLYGTMIFPSRLMTIEPIRFI